MISYEVLKGREIYSISGGELEKPKVIDVIRCKDGAVVLLVELYNAHWTIDNFPSELGTVYFLTEAGAMAKLKEVNRHDG